MSTYIYDDTGIDSFEDVEAALFAAGDTSAVITLHHDKGDLIIETTLEESVVDSIIEDLKPEE